MEINEDVNNRITAYATNAIPKNNAFLNCAGLRITKNADGSISYRNF